MLKGERLANPLKDGKGVMLMAYELLILIIVLLLIITIKK